MFRLITAAIFLVLPSLTQAAEFAQSAEVSTTSPVFTSPSHEMLAGHWTMVKFSCPESELLPEAKFDFDKDQLAIRFFANDESRAHAFYKAYGCSGEIRNKLTVEGSTIRLSEGQIIRLLCQPGIASTPGLDSPPLQFEFRPHPEGNQLVLREPNAPQCRGYTASEGIFVRTPTM